VGDDSPKAPSVQSSPAFCYSQHFVENGHTLIVAWLSGRA